MSEQPDANSSSPTLIRAEHALDNVEQHIKSLLDTTGHQFQQVTHELRTRTEQMTQAAHEKPPTNRASHNGSAEAPTTERAEQLVNTWGHQLNIWSERAGHQLAQTTARLREETEDIWAEAQNIRHVRNHSDQTSI